MDGHECSEILLSSLERTNRLDSEFYKKNSLQIMGLLKSISANPLTNFVTVSDGNHMGISNKFIGKGIPYYRGQDIHNFFIEDSNPICIDEDTFNVAYMYRSHLKKGDILLSIVGTIGEVSLVSRDNKATCNCKLAILRPHNTEKSAIIAIYLKTKYGFDQIDKFKRGTVQMGYLLEDMNQILIPNFSDDLEKIINKAIFGIKSLTERSNLQFAEAENCLLAELSIDMSTISSNGVTIKSFSESIGNTGRLDAEYYEKKNYEVIDKLNTKETIRTFCNIYDKSFTPNDNEYYKYIELANIGKSGEIDGVKSIIGSELPSRARRMVKKGYVIVSSIEGSLESCAIITETYDNALCSTGFYVIDSENYNSETLLVLLKSKPIQKLLKRGCSGTILTNIAKDEFLQIPLPEVSQLTQNIIKEKVSKAYLLRDQSKKLLECAKSTIEMAIETDETSAISWLKAKIVELTNE